MKTIIFPFPGNEALSKKLAGMLGAEIGELLIRPFPDGETYLQIKSDVKDKKVVIVATLHQPDQKLLPLYFFSKTAKELGAQCTCLVAPYLAYMRQDKRFQPGEAITSTHFAQLISQFADSLITIDPHLHRRSSLSEIYQSSTRVLHAATLISHWIRENIQDPLIIGPDSESEQWISEVAKHAGAPFLVLDKVRHGDKKVQVSVPDVSKYSGHTPVLVDDIISTARTMIEAVKHLKVTPLAPPVCIGIHAIFAGDAYEELKQAGAGEIITCNTILHPSNRIEIAGLLAGEMENYKA